jgi:predicted metal-dependent phosphoesterase TrpH
MIILQTYVRQEVSNMSFIHLHTHSNFSFKDATLTVAAIADSARRLGMPVVALTDHDNLCGAVRFYEAAREAAVKPIIGVELATAEGHHDQVVAVRETGVQQSLRGTGGHRGERIPEAARPAAATVSRLTGKKLLGGEFKMIGDGPPGFRNSMKAEVRK